MTTRSIDRFSLDELAVIEAAERGCIKAKKGKQFDADVFQAVAVFELKRLRDSL